MEIPISQDIRKYKTKDIGNFSFKEAGYIVLGIGVAIITYKLLNSIEAALIPLMIVIAFGFLKPYGMTCIQFLRTVGKEKITPPTYIFETDFVYDLNEIKEEYGDEYNVVIPDTLIQSKSANNTQQRSKFEQDLIIR